MEWINYLLILLSSFCCLLIGALWGIKCTEKEFLKILRDELLVKLFRKENDH